MKSVNRKEYGKKNSTKTSEKEKTMKSLAKALIALIALLFSTASASSIAGPDSLEIPRITYYGVDSDTAIQHTMELREAQGSTTSVMDLGEDIVFVMDSGINVQFANGSGRRTIINRGGGYQSFMYPAWSLDGTRIAFSAVRTDPRVVDLVVANSDGSNPTVILTLAEGYYNSFIQSISWHWADEYIMFTYAFNDINLNSLFVVCTIHFTGADFTVGPGPDRSYCQYEPTTGSQRYAYIAAGRPFYFNTDLRVSNLDGSNDHLWLQFPGTIAGFTHVLWNGPNSLYTIIRNWDQYPNREALLRVDKVGGQFYYTVVSLSDPYASLWSPTSSPSRNQLYTSEMTNNSSTLWLTTLDSNGNAISVVPKGAGLFPNWRQEIPTDVTDEGVDMPEAISLMQNYPNPFNANTVIEYSLSETAPVTVEIFDLLGKKVETLENGIQGPGSHSLTWDASNVATGTYFYRITVNDVTQTRKMTLIK